MKTKNKNSPIVDELILQRQKRKLTQEELAQIVGCPQSSIARIESGLVSPTLQWLIKYVILCASPLFLKTNN